MSNFPTPWRLEMDSKKIKVLAANGLYMSCLVNNSANRATAKLLVSAPRLLVYLARLVRTIEVDGGLPDSSYFHAKDLVDKFATEHSIKAEDIKLEVPRPVKPREHHGTDPNIGKMLMLSTIHIPRQYLAGGDFGPCRASESEHGWVVWPKDPEVNDGFSEWFGPINMWAYQNGYTMIEFDQDNEVHPKFRQFEHVPPAGSPPVKADASPTPEFMSDLIAQLKAAKAGQAVHVFAQPARVETLPSIDELRPEYDLSTLVRVPPEKVRKKAVQEKDVSAPEAAAPTTVAVDYEQAQDFREAYPLMHTVLQIKGVEAQADSPVEQVDLAKQAERDQKATEFGVKYGASPIIQHFMRQKALSQVTAELAIAAQMHGEKRMPYKSNFTPQAATQEAKPRFNKHITREEGFKAIQEYFVGRAPQMLWSGYDLKHVACTQYGGFAIWASDGGAKTYVTPYLYKEERGSGQYKDVCRRMLLPILTIDDCKLGGYLRKYKIEHVEVVLPIEYRLVEEYYAGKFAKRTGLPYMRHIDDGLRILKNIIKLGNLMDRDNRLVKIFCVHPIYQDNSSEYKLQHVDTCGLGLYDFCNDYARVANSYLTKDYANLPTERLVKGCTTWLLSVADKLQNFADFSANDHKFESVKRDQLYMYFSRWFDALGVTNSDRKQYTGQ